MDDLIEEIEFAVQHEKWMLALAGALALPDMCAALQSQNGQTSGSKYKNWVRTHLSDKYERLDPDELYKLRCSFLHQGTTSTLKYQRVVFCAPDSGFHIHNTTMATPEGAAMFLDLPTFCHDMLLAVAGWRASVEGTANYRRNISKVLRWRKGMAPYFAVNARVLA